MRFDVQDSIGVITLNRPEKRNAVDLDMARRIASAVEQQGAATQEIARNVQEAAQGTQAVSTNIASVNHAANGTGRAAQEMLGAADSLTREASTLRDEVARFLSGVKAA